MLVIKIKIVIDIQIIDYVIIHYIIYLGYIIKLYTCIEKLLIDIKFENIEILEDNKKMWAKFWEIKRIKKLELAKKSKSKTEKHNKDR